MFLIKIILLFFFVSLIESELTVIINKLTEDDLTQLKEDYKNMENVKLQDHPFYSNRFEDLVVYECPKPWNHKITHGNLYYGKINVARKTLFNVVEECLENEKYELGYAIFLNTIESVGITYIYQFCEFAIEMNKNCADLSSQYEESNKVLKLIATAFSREHISLKPYDCVNNVYIKHHPNHRANHYTTSDEDYRNELLKCMNKMKKKINFVKFEPSSNPEELSVENLIAMQTANSNKIGNLFKGDRALKHLKIDKGKEKVEELDLELSLENNFRKSSSFHPMF